MPRKPNHKAAEQAISHLLALGRLVDAVDRLGAAAERRGARGSDALLAAAHFVRLFTKVLRKPKMDPAAFARDMLAGEERRLRNEATKVRDELAYSEREVARLEREIAEDGSMVRSVEIKPKGKRKRTGK